MIILGIMIYSIKILELCEQSINALSVVSTIALARCLKTRSALSHFIPLTYICSLVRHW